jgi:hypothetical protein
MHGVKTNENFASGVGDAFTSNLGVSMIKSALSGDANKQMMQQAGRRHAFHMDRMNRQATAAQQRDQVAGGLEQIPGRRKAVGQIYRQFKQRGPFAGAKKLYNSAIAFAAGDMARNLEQDIIYKKTSFDHPIMLSTREKRQRQLAHQDELAEIKMASQIDRARRSN